MIRIASSAVRWLALATAVFLVGLSAACEEEPAMQWNTPPAMTIDTEKQYTAILALEKEDATVEVMLFADKAPTIVNNFVFLARQGYYDGVTFHRVIAGFMAQSGDPTGTGRGGPGYQIDNEFHPDLRHDMRGRGAARRGGPAPTRLPTPCRTPARRRRMRATFPSRPRGRRRPGRGGSGNGV